MTQEKIIRAAFEMLRKQHPENDYRKFDLYNGIPVSDPSAVSFVKRDGVWELPR